MHKNRIIIILAAMFIMVIGSAYVLYDKLGSSVEHETLITEQTTQTTETTEETKEETTKPNAPDFTVEDAEGNSVKLSDFYGKPTIVNFWASWCGICKTEMPDFEQAYKIYGEDINFLMVNVTDGSKETLKSAKDFLSNESYTFPVYFDTGMIASISYGVTGLPTTYFFDADGNAVVKTLTYTNLETIEKGIELISE